MRRGPVHAQRRGTRVTAVSLAAAIATAAASPVAAQVSAAGSVTVGRVEHRVDAGYGVAASAGTVLGLATRVHGWNVLELAAHAAGGRLQGDTVARADRRMGELGVRLSILPFPWLAVGGVATVRGYDAPAATQRWTMAGAGAELRMDFAGGGVRSVVGAALLPAVRVTGQPNPDLAVATNAGLQLARGRMLAGMAYLLERYVFPGDAIAGARHEQLAGLRFNVGARW